MGQILAIFTSYAQVLFDLMQSVAPGRWPRPALVDVEAPAMPSTFYFELVATSRSGSVPPYLANMLMKIEPIDASSSPDSAAICARCTAPAAARKHVTETADAASKGGEHSSQNKDKEADGDADEAFCTGPSSFTIPPPSSPSLLDLPIPSSSSYDSIPSPPTPTLSRGLSRPVSLLYPNTPSPTSSKGSFGSYPSTPTHPSSRGASLRLPSTPSPDRFPRRNSLKRSSRTSGAPPLIGLGLGFIDGSTGRAFSGLGILPRRASIISSDGSGSDVTDARDNGDGAGHLQPPSKMLLDEVYDTFAGELGLDSLITPARPAGTTNAGALIIPLLHTPLVDDVFREDEVSYYRAVLSTPRKASRKHRNRGRVAYKQQTAASARRSVGGLGGIEGTFGSQTSLSSSVGSETRPRWKY
ncbi:hypothetical protein OF83DRAFT_1295755 [Amylostereum chailletii]|nr:hypothetical protein OF83DRAFT_1295755 [Amylostereum chailletii]